MVCSLRSQDGERYPRALRPVSRAIAVLARTRSASSSARLCCAGGTCAQLWCATSWPSAITASQARGWLSMVKPGMNQVARIPRAFNNARMRSAPIRPNSPRDSGVGVVMPRAMKPDWVSKSKVRQTMWRGTARLRDVDMGLIGIA